MSNNHFGNPKDPCGPIRASRGYVEAVSIDVTARVNSGALPQEAVVQLPDFGRYIAKSIGERCSALCARNNGCILEPVPGLKPSTALTEEEQAEFNSARYVMSQLQMMAEEATFGTVF